MITSDAWRGKRYAVLGLARSGAATVRALLASGAEVVAWDAREEARAQLSLSPSGERLGEGESVNPSHVDVPLSQPSPLKRRRLLSFADPLTIPLTNFDAIIVSPGVPLNRHPIAAHARAYGVPIIGDIELFAQARPGLPPHKVVGITGTNGKSTTTALIHHILVTAGIPATLGGNIGLPILGQDPLPEGGVYVLELSSFQIDLTFSLDCDVAVLTNITPDHLDRYESFDAYAASKARLFQMQSDEHERWAIFAGDDSTTVGLCNDCVRANNEKASKRRWVWWVDNSWEELFGATVHEGEGLLWGESVGAQCDWPSLAGPHNAENAGAAMLVADALTVSKEQIAAALRTYPGLPHRMERVRELNGVLYVNDSKATNATSAAPALAAYPAVHWILGGQAKTKELDACTPHFGHVRAAYTIGEAGPMFAELLRPHMKVDESGTLEAAVTKAARAAQPGETVLLSPACASFDQFRDFEARGDAFRAAVGALQ